MMIHGFDFLKNGEKVIYTAHGLLAVTSNSGVFSLHQFILFFHFFVASIFDVGDKFDRFRKRKLRW